jgi:hypothetical protein
MVAGLFFFLNLLVERLAAHRQPSQIPEEKISVDPQRS